jgi:hypothetical protein|tara:strand:- start:257 stop:901 length:645 start_codon:yes stop_codon:yes gene_type:complete
MATVEPKSLYAVSPAEPENAYFTVSINTAGFLDTETANGGRISPCVANDFATKPTTIAQSRLVSQGALRFKMMMENLALRTNFKVVNIVTTYASDAGDQPITALAFGLVYENRNLVANTGVNTLEDSTAISTRAAFIKDRIADALNTTRTEKMSVFDPTTGNSNIKDEEVTAGPVLTASLGEISEAVTVSEVTGFAPLTSTQLTTDNALSYTSE